jgi:hypothetical protein
MLLGTGNIKSARSNLDRDEKTETRVDDIWLRKSTYI